MKRPAGAARHAVWQRHAVVAALLATVGCRSPQQRIERYLGTSTDRPEAVLQALREGDRPVPGMTPQEVRLIRGAPARTETGQPGTGAIWHYDQPERRDDTLRSSDMWALPVPVLTVVFGPDHTVTEIIRYDEQQATPGTEQPAPTVTTRTPPPRPEPLPPATPAAMPAYRPGPEELNVHGWPAITLQGLTGGGHVRRAAINGAVHEPGDRIGEVRLDAVYANGVVLEYRGQRAFLRPGESTGNGDGR